MFIIRTVFWLGIVVLLLPADKASQQKLTNAAVDAYGRLTTFCERNSATCVKAHETWATFKAKAEFGAELVGDLVLDRRRPAEQQPTESAVRRPALTRDTLNASDMEPSWRAPARRPRG